MPGKAGKWLTRIGTELKIGYFENFADRWSDLEVTQFVLGSENIARRSYLSVTRPTRALKEPDKMNKTVVKAKMGAVLSNMPINGCFCTTKKLL